MFYIPEIGDGYPIESLNEEKRIRVFGSQLMDAVIDDTTLAKFNWSIGFFFKTGIHLIERFPDRETDLEHILINFWKKMQLRYKQLREK